MGQAWSKKPDLAPNVVSQIKRFNQVINPIDDDGWNYSIYKILQVSSWIVGEVVTQENKKDRVKLLKKFINIAKVFCFLLSF